MRRYNFDSRLGTSAENIFYWSNRYRNSTIDQITKIGLSVQAKGQLTKSDFLEIAAWKSPRSKQYCMRNTESFVVEVTQNVLKSKCDRFRIEALMLIKGVSWPTASVILHFCHPDPYPILDYRALWTLGVEVSRNYDFELWQQYTAHCRALAKEAEVSMSTLDKALWQYSKENQL